MTEEKIYSVNQIGCGTFLGGPLAAIYMFKKNFAVAGNKNAERNTFLIGWLFVLFLIAIIPFLPKSFPHVVIPIFYTVYASVTAKKYKDSFGDHPINSNWKAVGVSILSFTAFIVLYLIYFFMLAYLGYINLGKSEG